MLRRRFVVLCALPAALAASCDPAPPRDPASASGACVRQPSGFPTDGAEVDQRFLAIEGDSLEYLDFGGEGLPVVFTGGSWSADTWRGFAPRFTDCFRVLAVTDRGIAPSSGTTGSVERRGEDILVLMDSLGIDQAVVVGHTNPAVVMIYLAEHHPDRLAGLVFLAPASEAGEDPNAILDDPSGAAQMIARGFASMRGRDPDESLARSEEVFYTPRYLQEDRPEITVPALTFVNLDGTRGIDQVVAFTEMARGSVDETGVIPEAVMPDSLARTYLTRLATDPVLQAEVKRVWDSLRAPAFRANERAFFAAWGDNIRAVPIDVPLWAEVPVVQGYEFRDSPELIEEHVWAFLEEVSGSTGG